MKGIRLFDLAEVPAELRDCFEEVETTCGAPWARVVEVSHTLLQATNNSTKTDKAGVWGWDHAKNPRMSKEVDTLDWKPTCRCPEQEPRPGLILDPFSGSARTGLTAIRMGLDYVGVELSPEYVEMSRKLLRQDAPLFAGGVE